MADTPSPAPATTPAPAATAPPSMPEVSSTTNGTTTAPAHESFPQIRQTRIPDKVMDAFRKRAKPAGREMESRPGVPEPPKASDTPDKPEDKAIEDEQLADQEESELGEESETTLGESIETKPEVDPKATQAKSKKVSAWKLVDQYKTRCAALEKELAESKTKTSKPGDPAPEFTERLTKAESRAKELEEEIRFVNYQKSGEFQDQFQKPYEAAWARAVKELGEVSVTDSAGNARAATAEDMLTLVNLPLGKAREVADSMFGPFANDAMAHRKEIKALFDKQQDALKDAHTKAAEWEKTRAEVETKTRTEIDKAVGETWAKANTDAATDSKYGKYFVPRENDPDWNQRLSKGFELVDKAFADANPRDPRLNAEQRKSIVERHAAVRNRAAAFGPLRFENERLTARLEEVEKELAEYKKTEAPQGGGPHPAAKSPSSSSDPWSRIQEGLRKRAHPRMI